MNIKRTAEDAAAGEVVPKEARWSHLHANAKQPSIGKLIDEAMPTIQFGESRPERRPAQELEFDR